MSTVCQHCHAPQADDAAQCASCGRPMPLRDSFLFAPPVPLRPAQPLPEAAPVFLPEPPGAMRRVVPFGLPALALLAVVFLAAPFLHPVPRALPAAARQTEARMEESIAPSTTFIYGAASEQARVDPPLRVASVAPPTPAASPRTLTVPRQPGHYRIAGRLVTVQSASQPERAERVAARPARHLLSTPGHSRLHARTPRPAPIVKVAASLEDAAAPRFYHVVACRFPRSYNAAVLTEALRRRGFAAVMRRESGGTRFAVETGTFRRLDTARQALQNLRQSGYQPALVAEK